MVATESQYQLTFEDRKNYLYVRVTADSINPATAIEYWSQITHKCSEMGCEQLIFVRDIPEMLNDSDLYFTTTGFQQMIGPRKVAVVNPHKALHEDVKFAVVIGMNRGGHFNIFDNEVEAERWLVE